MKKVVIARRVKPDEAIQVQLTKWANFSMDCFAFARNDGALICSPSSWRGEGMPLVPTTYVPPRLFKNAHLQTIYANYVRKVPLLAYQRDIVVTPDGDFLHMDWVLNSRKRLVVLTHGIAGDSQCPYMRGMGQAFLEKGWSVLAWNMRGRGSDKPNVKKENYHMGFTHDLRFVVDYVIQEKMFCELVIIGFSMGGNILLKYLGEEESYAPAELK